MATTTGGGTPRNRWILHFTHIDNVPAIISGGRLACDKAAQPYLQTEVGDSAIKEARRRRVLTAGPGGTVADYVPFYFAPRSPMMFRIACDHRDGVPGRYPDGDRPLVYFAATAGAVVDAGLAWVATDGNAANAATEFSTDVTRLDAMIDWAVMVASQWNNTTTDPDRQRRRMAEFLVHREVPLTVVHQIAAYSDWYADRVRQAVAGHALDEPGCCPTGVVLRVRKREVRMMIEEGHGNLLAADVDALVNTVNTVGIMGKGIALQFKRAFPANYRAYRSACTRGEVQLGRMLVFDNGGSGPRRFIINFPTKEHWRSRSRLEDIRSGLGALVSTVAEHGITSLAIPALGCGNGGLDWREVRPLIERACARMPVVRAVVFAPEGAPGPTAMPNVTAKPELTLLRALLLVAIGRYLDRARLQEIRDGISELEIQKIAYFLQLLGAPLRLDFTRGRYGPYADRLGHVLNELEGHFLSGLGDRSARVTELTPINPIAGSLEAARKMLDRHPDDLARVDAMVKLVDGFETPYSLELLATVHFASVHPPATAHPALLADRVAAWSLRKARLFTVEYVRIAAAQLGERGLLGETVQPATR